MAPRVRSRKRKQDTEPPDRSQPRKRQRPSDSAAQGDDYFLAKTILRETATKYLIDWVGTDPTTGEAYAPTWEPKKNALPALVEDWKAQKKSIRSRRRSPSPTAAPSNPEPAREQLPQPSNPEISSSPPVEISALGFQNRSTTFTHSQPTPSHTPGHTPDHNHLDPSQQTDGWVTDTAGAVDETHAGQTTVAIVPSQRRLDSDLYETFSSQQQATSSSTLPATPERRPTVRQRVNNFVVPDTQEPDSASFLPGTATDSGLHKTTQDGESSSVAGERTSSPIEEITQFNQASDDDIVDESDPITDLTSPQNQDSLVPGAQDSLTLANSNHTGRSGLGSTPKSSVLSAVDTQVPGPQSLPSQDAQGDLLQTQTPHQAISVESGPSAALVQADNSQLNQSVHHSNSHSGSHNTNLHSSSTSERDCAGKSHISATAEVIQSIERSPTPATLVAPNSQRTQPTQGPADQADVSTEGEYSGQHGNSLQPQSLPANSPPQHQLSSPAKHVPTAGAPQGPRRLSASQPSSSTHFATQIPRTPLRAMDATSVESTPDGGARTATRSLAEKLAEVSRSGPRRGRSLKDIALAKGAKDETRSPSAIPDKYPYPNPPDSDRSRMRIEDFGPELRHVPLVAPVPESATIAEESVAVPDAADRSSPLSAAPDEMDDADDTEDTPTFPNLGPSEYALALPSPGSSTDAYRKHLTAHAKLITDFCSRPWPDDADIVAKAAKLVQELENYVTHPDLENEDALTQQTSTNESLSALSEWDMSVSAKFNFLAHLLAFLGATDVHIVVATANTIIIDRLKVFLKGRGVHTSKPSGEGNQQDKIPEVFVSIVHTVGDTVEVPRPADLVVTFDNSLDTTDAKVVGLRQSTTRPGTLAPVLHLFVDYSIEHVDCCLPRNLVGVERLQRLLNSTTEYRRSAGKLGTYEPRPKDAAQLVASHLIEKSYGATGLLWPLSMPDIIDVEPMSQSSSGSASAQGDADDAITGQKRPLAEDTSEESHKRARVNEQPPPIGNAFSPNRISNSAAPQSSESQGDVDDGIRSTANGAPLEPQAASDAQDRMLKLSNEVIRLSAALEGLQGRFEEQTKELRATRKEREAAKVRAAIFQKQVESRDTTITSLKDERSELKKQVQAQSEVLQASSIPEIAELERMRTALAAMEKDRDRADARYKSGESTNDYMRTQYQQASGRAMELSAEVDALKARSAELEVKASGEAAKLKQLQSADRERAWRDEAELLRGRIESLEILVTRLQEQKRELQNQGRVQTRQGSMPPAARSPRVGAGSRAASPAPVGFGLGGSRLR